MELFSVMKQIASGFGSTLIIFFFTLLFSIPLGILVALGRMSKFKPLSLLIQAIISILRGTPLMLQLIVVFYGPYFHQPRGLFCGDIQGRDPEHTCGTDGGSHCFGIHQNTDLP